MNETEHNMPSREEIEEAIEFYNSMEYNPQYNPHEHVLLNLAKRYLAVEAEMPKIRKIKDPCKSCNSTEACLHFRTKVDGECNEFENYLEKLSYQGARAFAINSCTLITTRLLGEKDKEIVVINKLCDDLSRMNTTQRHEIVKLRTGDYNKDARIDNLKTKLTELEGKE